MQSWSNFSIRVVTSFLVFRAVWCLPSACIEKLLRLCLKHAHPPSRFGRRQDCDVTDLHMMRAHGLAMVDNFHIVFGFIDQLDR